MRVWDVPPSILCRQHLLGEHREIHAIFSVIANGKKGYSRHTETLRWVGKLDALKARHDLVVSEMLARGWNHKSPLPATGDETWQDELLLTPWQQVQHLRKKGCTCETGGL